MNNKIISIKPISKELEPLAKEIRKDKEFKKIYDFLEEDEFTKSARSGKIKKSDISSIISAETPTGVFVRNGKIIYDEGAEDLWSLYYSGTNEAKFSKQKSLNTIHLFFDVAKNFKSKQAFQDFYNQALKF